MVVRGFDGWFVALGGLALTLVALGPAPLPYDGPGEARELIEQYVTYYGWPDNDPPGPAIAYPRSRWPTAVHDQAGGVGTYEDPITMASDPTEWAVGTRMYLPYLQKYVVMEDWCAGCVRSWRGRPRRHHIDIWMNSDSTRVEQLLQCQFSWTRETEQVEIQPPAGRPVVLEPLFDPATGTCRGPS